MKKIIYFFTVIIFVSACNSEVSIEVTNDNISKIFKKNCETVKAYESAFCQENIDYDKFYSEKAIIKGTILGDKDSMYVADRKVAHQELWKNMILPCHLLIHCQALIRKQRKWMAL